MWWWRGARALPGSSAAGRRCGSSALLVAYFSSPWQLPISVPEPHKALPVPVPVPVHGRWGQGRGQWWGGCARSPLHPFPGYRGPDPAADPQPRPRYLRLRLLHLVLRLHQLLVDLLQPRGADLGGQSGRQGGLGPPRRPPGTPKGRQGAGREPGAGGKGAKVGGMGLGIRTYRAGAWGSGPGRMGPVHSCTPLGAGMQGFEGDRVGWAGLGGG